jgi:hypothetical protein
MLLALNQFIVELGANVYVSEPLESSIQGYWRAKFLNGSPRKAISCTKCQFFKSYLPNILYPNISDYELKLVVL